MLQNLFETLLNPPAGAISISQELAESFGLTGGEKRLDVETFGPWRIPVRLRGLCVTTEFDKTCGYTRSKGFACFGVRTMTRPRESGYQMEGQVSVMGRKVRAFTSSKLFQLPSGKLIDCGVIFACL